jgi:hypothetical protein
MAQPKWPLAMPHPNILRWLQHMGSYSAEELARLQ